MPVYASTSAVAGDRRHPKTLLLILAAHAVALAAVMSAKMEIVRSDDGPTLIKIPLPKDPPPPEPKPQPKDQQTPRDLPISVPDVLVPTPPIDTPIKSDPTPLPPLPGPVLPHAGDPGPTLPLTRPDPVRTGPRFATAEHWLKPPYPPEKIRLEEEAALKLRLTIDERGRVIAVDPVGNPDPSFLAAARKHILARWKYKPATEDGRPVQSSTVITLRFQLDEA
jgi:protein TonB